MSSGEILSLCNSPHFDIDLLPNEYAVSIAENNTDTFNLQTILCREQEFVIF